MQNAEGQGVVLVFSDDPFKLSKVKVFVTGGHKALHGQMKHSNSDAKGASSSLLSEGARDAKRVRRITMQDDGSASAHLD
jgi:hypothetical protein